MQGNASAVPSGAGAPAASSSALPLPSKWAWDPPSDGNGTASNSTAPPALPGGAAGNGTTQPVGVDVPASGTAAFAAGKGTTTGPVAPAPPAAIPGTGVSAAFRPTASTASPDPSASYVPALKEPRATPPPATPPPATPSPTTGPPPPSIPGMGASADATPKPSLAPTADPLGLEPGAGRPRNEADPAKIATGTAAARTAAVALNKASNGLVDSGATVVSTAQRVWL